MRSGDSNPRVGTHTLHRPAAGQNPHRVPNPDLIHRRAPTTAPAGNSACGDPGDCLNPHVAAAAQPQTSPGLFRDEGFPSSAPPDRTARGMSLESEPGHAPRFTTTGWRDRLVLDTLRLLLRHRVLCIITILAAAAAGSISTLRVPPYYQARATIYPPPSDSPLGGLGFAGMAGIVGNLALNSTGSSQFPLYERILYSRKLISSLLTIDLEDAGFKGTLLEYLGITEPRAELRDHLAVKAIRAKFTYERDNKTPVATIVCQDSDPKVAALVVNRAVEFLNQFDISTSANQAREHRKFVEARLTEAARSLAIAEERLERFRANNVRIGNAPDLLLEQSRLQREIEIEQQIYLTLRKEAELARIEERRAVPVVNILDRATPPVSPAGPSLVRNTVLAGFVGTLVVVGLSALRALASLRTIPELGFLSKPR